MTVSGYLGMAAIPSNAPSATEITATHNPARYGIVQVVD